jgi:RimJ/RimL family protein N-acetyltransferase
VCGAAASGSSALACASVVDFRFAPGFGYAHHILQLPRRAKSSHSSDKSVVISSLKTNPELLRSTFELEDKLDVAWFAGRLEDAHIVGAFRDGELVGTAGFSIQRGQPTAHKGRLFGMYVRSSSRNLGVGRLLLSAVLDIARENVELIQLSVVRESRPARRLYESAGFIEFGVETKASKYGDRYYDEALMALDFSRPTELP